MTSVEDARKFYAQLMAANAGSADPRLEEAFATVPREAFLGPGPWTVIVGRMVTTGNGRVMTPSDDPVHIYQDVLVALDADKGINNGEPSLHAMWIGRIAPRPGEAVTHVARVVLDQVGTSIAAGGEACTVVENPAVARIRRVPGEVTRPLRPGINYIVDW